MGCCGFCDFSLLETENWAVVQMNKMVNRLKDEGVFAKFVPSAGVPFHTPLLERVRDELLDKMRKVNFEHFHDANSEFVELRGLE